MPKVIFAKVKESAVIPSKNPEDSGFDIYSCFEGNMILPPHSTTLVPTGIASALEPGWGFRIEERGSTGSIGLKKSAGIIDSGYRGEWFIALTNTNPYPIVLSDSDSQVIKNFDENENIIGIFYPKTKAIAQATLEKIYDEDIEVIPYEDLLKIPSKRGTGALGSSGK